MKNEIGQQAMLMNLSLSLSLSLSVSGEEFAGPTKLGLAHKVLQNLWGFVRTFLQYAF